MSIGVVIPNYNGFNLIIDNFSLIVKSFSGYEDVKIIVVDDGSSGEEQKKLENFLKDYKDVKLLKNEKNLGFSSTVNRGVKALDTDLVVLLNTDVIPHNNFLDSIIEDFNKNDLLFGVGCMDESIEGEKVILRGRGIGFWKNGMFFHKKGEVDSSNTFWVSGGSSVLRREIFNKLGGFDELYDPFYWEDIDLSYRAMKSGYSLKFEAKSKVTHRHSEGAIKKHYKNFRIKTISYRNQFMFVWKNISDPEKILAHVLFLPYYMLISLLAFDLSFYSGFFLALVKFPDIIKKRIKQKKMYKATDKVIFSSFTHQK